MAIHFSILAWRIPWTEEPGGTMVCRVAKSQTRRSNLAQHIDVYITNGIIKAIAHA